MEPQNNLTEACYSKFAGTARQVSMARAITGGVTLVISILALLSILWLRAFKSYSQRLFLYLTLITLIQSPGYALEMFSIDYSTSEARQPFCYITGTCVMYIAWLQNFVMVWITCYIFRVIVLRKKIATRFVEIAIILTFLVLGLPFALPPLISKKYGNGGMWCWITSENKTDCNEIDELGFIYQLSLWFVPTVIVVTIILGAILTIVAVFLVRGYINTRYQVFQAEYRRLLKESLPLIIFPVLYVVINCLELGLYVGSSRHQMHALWMVNAVVTPFKGMLMVAGYLLPLLWVRVRRACSRNDLKLFHRYEHSDIDTNIMSVRYMSAGRDYGAVDITPENSLKGQTRSITPLA